MYRNRIWYYFVETPRPPPTIPIPTSGGRHRHPHPPSLTPTNFRLIFSTINYLRPWYNNWSKVFIDIHLGDQRSLRGSLGTARQTLDTSEGLRQCHLGGSCAGHSRSALERYNSTFQSPSSGLCAHRKCHLSLYENAKQFKIIHCMTSHKHNECDVKSRVTDFSKQ